MGIRKTTWHHIRRSPYQAFAAVFIIMQTFFIVSVFTFVIVGSAKIITYFESLPQVSVFFKNEVKQAEIDGLKEKISKSKKASQIRFVSKQEALKRYQAKFKGDPLLLEFVTADILPASLEIQTTKIDDLNSISEMLKGAAYVKEVIFPKDVVSKLVMWTDALRKIGIALTIVLSLDSIFIMVIIIGIKISQKKEEIEIMRLLGATNWYVRWPFVFEGMLYGIIGAFIGWVTASAALWYAAPFLSSFLGSIPIFPISPFFLLQVLGIEFLFAICLGFIGSFFAVLRYLK